jgi:hypothetical protein
MKSKPLQKKSDCLNKSGEGLDGQQETSKDCIGWFQQTLRYP